MIVFAGQDVWKEDNETKIINMANSEALVIRIDRNTKLKLMELAQKEGRSMSNFVLRIIDEKIKIIELKNKII